METHTPQLGARMSPEQAKGYVDSVNKKALQRWQERVAQGPFMSRFLKGNLPLTAIRLFFKNRAATSQWRSTP